MKWRLGLVALLVLLFIVTGAIYYRGEIGEWLLFHGSRNAAAKGELQVAEQKLEALLETNPEFEGATDLLLDVSSRLVLPSLPLEFSARHDHLIGSCTGTLTLQEWGVEYLSREHGLLQWRFHQIHRMETTGVARLSLETYEGDMLGLRSNKNYNFTLLNTPLEEDQAKRYDRLFRAMRDQKPPE
jgi:hypothetical protein